MISILCALSMGQQLAANPPIRYRGMSAVNDVVCWASGTSGSVSRTLNGENWTTIQVTDAAALDFRDIEAVDENTAYALSIGPGENSRIYKTEDGGKNWTLQFKNQDPDAFYDALAFWDANHGITLSDPVKGHFVIRTTDDGGKTWKPQEGGMPPALQGEGAFAASGTCLITKGSNEAWFVTGSAARSRAFHSTDRGRTWTVQDLPIPAGKASAGCFSIAFSDSQTGIAVGGDYQDSLKSTNHIAITRDGGKTWRTDRLSRSAPFLLECALAMPGSDGFMLLGPDGLAYWSPRRKVAWKMALKLHTGSIKSRGFVFAAGENGSIRRLDPLSLGR